MSRITIIVLSIIAGVHALSVQAGDAVAKLDNNVITNVNVIPMDGERVLRNQSVRIEDGRIASIQPAGQSNTSDTTTVIDGDDGYLIPGLAEMHAHIPGADAPLQLRKDILFLYLANGVTLTRGMLGEPWHLELRQALANGEWTGPRLITSGPSLNGNTVDSPEQAARKVRRQAEAGYDFIKIHPGLSREEFDALASAADEVKMDFAGHVSRDTGIHRALEAGYATIDHLDRYLTGLVDEQTLASVNPGFFDYKLAPYVEPERIDRLARKTREAGVWNVPTQSLMQNVLLSDPEGIREHRPEFRYMPDEMVRGWIDRVKRMQNGEDYDRDAAEAYIRVRRDLVAALHDAGAGLLLGSDAPQIFNVPGFSIHHEMALMEKAGLSPYEVLCAATVNPARFFDAADEWGRIKPGMRAELVLLDANPLDDLANLREPRGVMTPTRWLDREAIDARLKAIEQRHAGERAAAEQAP